MMRFFNHITAALAAVILILPGLADAKTLRVGWPAVAVSAAYPFSRDDGGGMRYAIYDALTWIDINA